MPVLSLKKVRESPNPEEKEQVVTVEMTIPGEVFAKILFMLDGPSLHAARQVCQEWNSIIKQEVLDTTEGRREMEKTLQLQWREATPAKRDVLIGGSPLTRIRTDHLAVIYYDPAYSKPRSEMSKISVVNTSDGVELMEYSYLGGWGTGWWGIPRAVLSQDVLLLVFKATDLSKKVLAWNFRNGEKIFEKNYPKLREVVDRNNNKVMLGLNTRLEITEEGIIEVNFPHLPGGSILRKVSHPYYLADVKLADGSWLFDISLWKVEGESFSRVEEIGSESCGGLHTEFCPTRKIFVCISGYDHHKLRVFSSLTGQMLKERSLNIFGVDYEDEIKELAVNDSQLAVVTCQEFGDHYTLMVFQLDSLLSQTVDQEISHRTIEFDQNYIGLRRLDLHKTSISLVVEGVGEEYEEPPSEGSFEASVESMRPGGRRRLPVFQLITFDFWNCEN